uniref:Amidohydrolase-related domain-containing protein n=1 Tax=Setaria digitata TaxID=48799 RepID=A0A915PPB3_9BILA
MAYWRPNDTAKIFPFLAPLKGHLYTFHIRSTPNSPVEVCYSERKLKHDISLDKLHGTGSSVGDIDGTISGTTKSQFITKKSKPTTTRPLSRGISPKSPDRTGSRSSTSASSNLSRSPRSKSKTSNASLHSIRNVSQDSIALITTTTITTTTITTAITTTTTTTATATTTAAISSKRLVRKGLDVSPAMLEFFGMKAITGPSACFQFIEEREKPQCRSKGNAQYVNPSSIMGDKISGTENRLDEVTKKRLEKGYVKNLGEPGPEHFVGVEGAKDSSNMENEIAIITDEKEKEKEKTESNGMKSSRWREEMKRLAKSSIFGHNYQETNEPGPEYFSSANDSENGRNKIEENEIAGENRDKINNDLQQITSVETAVTCSAAARKEGGGLSMVTTNATADTMKSFVGGIAAVAGTEAARTGAVATTAAMTAVPITMDSGNSSDTVGIILMKRIQIINDDSIYMADVLIQNGIIQQLSSNIEEPPGAHVIDGTDKALMPAGIEVHTEFSLPDTVDNFETGSKAALAGGTATVIDVIQPGLHETLLTAYDRLCKSAQSKSLCNFAFSVIISEWNDMIKKEVNTLVHDKGINSFIVTIQKDDQLFEILEYCRSLRIHARFIPENKDIIALLEKRLRSSGITGTECFNLSRPDVLEADMVNRISVLGKLTKCPVAVISPYASEAAEIPVTVLDVRSDKRISSALHTPWRCAESHSPSISCLSSLPLCICISDKREMRKKDSSLENSTHIGVSALEERMSMLWTKGVQSGLIDPMRFVAITSSNAAKVFNLYPRKGRIAVGADADLVVWKLSMKHQAVGLSHQSSAFKVSIANSKPIMTICGGRIAYNNGKFDSGRGKLVELGPHSPYLYCMMDQMEEVQFNGGVDEGVLLLGSDHSHLKENLTNSSKAFPVKNLQKQQFESYSATSDDVRGMRASTKVLNPPGGRSTGFW